MFGDRASQLDAIDPNRFKDFFKFHPRDCYKPSFCVTFSNTFGNLWSLEELMSSGIKLEYDQVYKSWGNFLFNRRVDFFHEISREYVKMFLHPIGVSWVF